MKTNLRSFALRGLVCLPLLVAPIACGGGDQVDETTGTDMGTMDTGMDDMGTMDTGMMDTGMMDTGMMDTGMMGTDMMDTGAMGTGGGTT